MRVQCSGVVHTVCLLGSEHERLCVLSYYLLVVGPKSHLMALCSSVLNLNICPFCRYHWELSTFISHSAPCWSQQHNFQSLDFWCISLRSEAAMFCESQFLSHTWGNNVTLQYFIKVYGLARAIFKRLMLLFMCLCECMWVHVGTDRRPEEGVDSSEAWVTGTLLRATLCGYWRSNSNQYKICKLSWPLKLISQSLQ